MNIENISLSSENTGVTTTLDIQTLNDYTSLTVYLSGVSEKLLPTNLSIDWGDGSDVETYDNDIAQTNLIIEDRFSSIFIDTFTHEYSPSNTTTTQSITATFTVGYVDGNPSTFYIPISVVNYDYQTAIEDMYLVNTIILPNTDNEKIHQFVTKTGGYMVELKTSAK